MKVGIDASCWVNRRGFGRFTRELLTALLKVDVDNQYFFLIDSHSNRECDFPAGASRMVVSTSHPPAKAAAAGGHRTISDILRMSGAAARGDFDLFFFPAVYSYFPLFDKTKCIVTFHDAIAERHPDLIFPTARARLFWQCKAWLASRQADWILTVSQYSRDCLINRWKLDARRVGVLLEAPSAIFQPVKNEAALSPVLKRFGLTPTAPYILYVGGISPHKNLESLVTVFCQLAQSPEFSATKLLLVGDYQGDVFHSSYSRLRSILESSHQASSVIFTGYVPDESLLHLYNGAATLVLPSLDEGFGLPAVEGMACGTPLVASRAGSLPEIIGNAGLFFDPRDPVELKNTLAAVLADPELRKDLATRSLRKAQEFSWSRSAEALLEIFRKTLQS